MGHDAAMGWSPLARRTAAVLAWALSTLLAATVAWWAVGTVGRGPGSSEGAIRSQTDVAADLVAARAAQAAARSATPSASPTSGPTPTTTPTTEPSATPTAEPPPTTAPVLPDVVRTWTVDGGQVSASCRGQQFTLLYATPQDGWAVETKNAGPDELLVEFGRADSETTLRAWCVNGTPQMEVGGTSDGAGSGGD